MDKFRSSSDKQEEKLWRIVAELYDLNASVLSDIDERALLYLTVDLNRLFAFNHERIKTWLKATNDSIGGKRPVQLLEEGRFGDLQRFISELMESEA